MALTDYLTARLGGLATQLNWISTNLAVVIDDALEAYPATLEADCTDLVKLHRLADYFLWKAVKTELAMDYNFSADGANQSRSQMFDHISDLESDAFSSAIPYLSEYAITVAEVDYTQNPYDIGSYFVEF
jgi:hypothetical protein